MDIIKSRNSEEILEKIHYLFLYNIHILHEDEKNGPPTYRTMKVVLNPPFFRLEMTPSQRDLSYLATYRSPLVVKKNARIYILGHTPPPRMFS